MEFVPSSMHAVRRVLLVDWLEQVLSAEHRKRAHGVFEGAVAQIPELVRYRITPQTPPHHAEGPNVAFHVERMLACVLAIEEGTRLSDIEELSRNPSDRLAIQEIEETIREHAAFFKVFALVHDIAKPDLVSFSAPQASKGAAEGFIQLDRRVESQASPKEIARFDKLIRAFEAAHPKLSSQELSLALFNEYQVSAHYHDHDRKGAGAAYGPLRSLALELFGVNPSFHKLLVEVIWSHIDVLNFFADLAAPAKYAFLEARARKSGLNADVFLTFLTCGVLLDAVLGSFQVGDGVLGSNVSLMLNMFASEREAVPLRNATRLAVEERLRKQAVKDILVKAKLSAEDIFSLIPTPFGPERGRVVQAAYDLVRGKTPSFDFGKHFEELSRRASIAKIELARRGLSL